MKIVSVSAHFDGEYIRLDDPLLLEPSTKLIVTVLPSENTGHEDWERLAREGRQVSEEWLIRNEKILLTALDSLLHEGDEEGFMIASIDPYYVQFAPRANTKSLYVEAISNANLPDHLHLSKEAVKLLKIMGFEEPVDNNSGYSNYHCTYQIGTAKNESMAIARKAVEVLASVYRVSEQSDLEIQLELYG